MHMLQEVIKSFKTSIKSLAMAVHKESRHKKWHTPAVAIR